MKNYTPITKFYALCIALVFFMMPCLAQNVAINEDGSLPNPKAILDVKSYSKGILIPRMSTADRLAIKAPIGMLVYDTITSSFWYSARVIPDSSGSTITIWQNLATGYGWSLRGNFVDSMDYLGPSNNVPLNIKVYGQPAGSIDVNQYNTYWGLLSGFSNTVQRNSAAYHNTATGYKSLFSNSTGYYNTASGANALLNNIGGDSNTAVGAAALRSNTTGGRNTAIGGHSLSYSTVGVNNTAIGADALFLNTTGEGNTGIGTMSFYNNRTGSFNTAIGFRTSATRDSFSNATAIGAHAVVNASNKVRIGNTAVTVIEGQVPFTVPSDGRYKFQIKEDVKGLDFILQLRPVTYQFDVKRFNAQYSQAGTANESSNGNYVLQTAYDEATSIRRSGFIAQEVEKAAVASGYNFSGIIQPKTAQEHYSLSYESFVVPLVKAIQELNEKNKKLEQEILEIKQLLQKLK